MYEEWSTVWLTVYKSVYSFGLILVGDFFSIATPGNLLPRDQRNIGWLSFHQDRVCHWHSPGNYLPHGSHRKFISCHWSTWQEVCGLGRGMCRERRWLHYLHYLGLCLSELGSIFMCSGSESRCTLFSRLVDYHRSLWWNCNSRCSCRNWLRHPCQMGTTLLWHWDNYYKEAWDLFKTICLSDRFEVPKPRNVSLCPVKALLEVLSGSALVEELNVPHAWCWSSTQFCRTAKKDYRKIATTNTGESLQIYGTGSSNFAEWLRCKDRTCNLSIHISNRIHLFFSATILGIFTDLYSVISDNPMDLTNIETMNLGTTCDQ